MRKFLIGLLLFIFIIAFSSYIYAAVALPGNIDPDVDNDTVTNQDNNFANNDDDALEEDDDDALPTANTNTEDRRAPSNTQTIPTATTSAPMDFFTAENILSIILITIGIVLILLSLAIFIRLKSM